MITASSQKSSVALWSVIPTLVVGVLARRLLKRKRWSRKASWASLARKLTESHPPNGVKITLTTRERSVLRFIPFSLSEPCGSSFVQEPQAGPSTAAAVATPLPPAEPQAEIDASAVSSPSKADKEKKRKRKSEVPDANGDISMAEANGKEDEVARAERKRLKKEKKAKEAAEEGVDAEDEEAKRERKRLKKEKKARESLGGES